jgi:hypothetical protein
MLPRGEYRFELVATAGGTTQIVRRTVQMEAFSITPSSTAPTAGSQLILVIRSAEALDARPSVTIAQPGSSARTMTAKRLRDGRYRAVLTLAAGATGTATITVKGLDIRGRSNATLLKLSVK